MKHKHPVRRRILQAILLLTLALVVAFALRSSPVLVELSKATRGPMRVTVDEDGETRAHDRFVIAAPIPGRLLRVGLEEGDAVRENEVVAVIEPLPLNKQQREEVLARIAAAEAVQREAESRVRHAREDYEQSRRDRARAEQLALGKVISAQALEQARNAEITSGEELRAARFNAQAAGHEVTVARAGLVGINGGSPEKRLVSLRSPVAGRILRIVEKSERVVQAGAPIISIGDPEQIEVVTDVLTTDAVRIKTGSTVFLDGWGGDQPLRAKVRLVEPAGFTKISALGVEEKRVNVIIDFVDPPGSLGDGYRVETHIVTWESADVLKIPGSATFREGDAWSVFVVDAGRARRRAVEIGRRNQTEAEVLGGLKVGEEVVLYPPNELREGVRVRTQQVNRISKSPLDRNTKAPASAIPPGPSSNSSGDRFIGRSEPTTTQPRSRIPEALAQLERGPAE